MKEHKENKSSDYYQKKSKKRENISQRCKDSAQREPSRLFEYDGYGNSIKILYNNNDQDGTDWIGDLKLLPWRMRILHIYKVYR